MSTATVQQLRKDFPVFANNPGLVYLDNAATTQKPQVVIDALNAYYSEYNANVHRALYGLADKATRAYEDARRILAEFIHAPDVRNLVFTHGTTEGINLTAHSFGEAFLQEGDSVLLTEMEHHSNLIPWQLLAKRKGITLKFIPFNSRGELELDAMDELWDGTVKLVSVVHVSNVFGTVNPVKKITEYAHSKGVPVLVDAAQSAPHIKLDVQDMDCDFLVFSGHKMYAPMGIGALYAKERYLKEMPPFLGGGEMILSVWLDKAKWNEVPYKFEAGTPNVGGAIAMGAAAEYMQQVGIHEIEQLEHGLLEYATKKLEKEVPGITIYGKAPHKSSVLSFNVEGLHSHDIAQFLDRDGVAIRSGHHCAHPAMRKLNIPSTARASFSFYNTTEEIDTMAASLLKAKEYFGHVL